jgi:biotin transporter BioY
LIERKSSDVSKLTNRERRGIFLGLAAVLLPVSAHADAGLMPLVVVWPAFLLALIPIALIETEVYRRRLEHVSYSRLLFAVTVANSVSTLLGVPIFLLVLVVGSVLTFSNFNSTWFNLLFLPGLVLAYLVPAYLVSVYSEEFVVRRMLAVDRKVILPASWLANLLSYILLVTSVVVYAKLRF